MSDATDWEYYVSIFGIEIEVAYSQFNSVEEGQEVVLTFRADELIDSPEQIKSRQLKIIMFCQKKLKESCEKIDHNLSSSVKVEHKEIRS